MMRALAIVLSLAIVACVPAENGSRSTSTSSEDLVWPSPPQKAKIRFLYAFGEPRDLGIHPGFFERIGQFFLGAEVQGMVRPYAVAAEEGVIAVADPGLRVLHLFDTAAEKYRRIEEVADERLMSPVGVGFGPNRIYLADSKLQKVFVLDREGNHIRTIGGLKRPTGIAFHRGQKRLFVADTLGHKIAVYDADGSPLLAFGTRGKEPGAFNYPSHLALRDDSLYVNDTMNFRIQSFDLRGNFLSSFGRLGDGSGDFAQPKGVGVDPEGHIYVADALFDRVQVFDPAGRFLLAYGGQGRNLGEFWLPMGVFFDGSKIFVADSYNQRVQVFEFVGSEKQ